MKEAAQQERAEGFKGSSDFLRIDVDPDELVQRLRARVLGEWLRARAMAARDAQDARRADREDSFFRVERWRLDVRRSVLGGNNGSVGLGCFFDDAGGTLPLEASDACVARIVRPASPSTLYREQGSDADAGDDVVNLSVARRLRLRRDYGHFTYVASLPERTRTPLEWTADELDDLLLGTTLYDAVVARRAVLHRRFDEMREDIDASTWRRLASILEIQQSDNLLTGFIVNSSMELVRLLSSSISVFRSLRNALMSVFDYRCTFADYLWAAATYRSRMMHVPVGIGAGGGASDSGGCVILAPGIDFVNHQRGANASAYWHIDVVDDDTGNSDGVGGGEGVEQGEKPKPKPKKKNVHVSLFVKRDRIRAVSGGGEEITIDYGGKSNEELLFLHGFCEDRGSDDEKLMVHVPLPPARRWGEGMQRRMKLIQMLQVPIQFFIRRGDVARADSTTGALFRRLTRWTAGATVPSWCTDDMLDVMRVFTLNDEEITRVEKEAAAVIEGLNRATSDDGAASEDIDIAFLVALRQILWGSSPAPGLSAKSSGGVRPPRRVRLEMERRALSLLRELLTTKLDAMVAGTGTIDEDEHILEKFRGAKADSDRANDLRRSAAAAAVITSDTNTMSNAASMMAFHATVYRKAQKEIAASAIASLGG